MDLQSVTGPKNARTGVDWRYCTAGTPHPSASYICTQASVYTPQTKGVSNAVAESRSYLLFHFIFGDEDVERFLDGRLADLAMQVEEDIIDGVGAVLRRQV